MFGLRALVSVVSVWAFDAGCKVRPFGKLGFAARGEMGEARPPANDRILDRVEAFVAECEPASVKTAWS